MTTKTRLSAVAFAAAAFTATMLVADSASALGAIQAMARL
jgi:hypothetical protein